jgi:RNA polymerase sigma factor (sigma-70 family)
MDMSVGFYLEAPAVAGGRLGDCDGRDRGHSHGHDRGLEQRGVALRDCLAANYAHLHRRLLRYLGCADQASDCLHDAWLRLGETSVSAAVQNPEAYVYRVACNVAIDRLRGERALLNIGGIDGELDQIADHAPGPDMVAEARSELEAMARALQRLPRLHSAILMALRVDEIPRQEVADRYGLSLRTVDTALRRALECCGRK